MTPTLEHSLIADRSDAPIATAAVKHYLRLTHAEDDALLARMVWAAYDMAEAYMLRAIMPQSWRVTYGIAPPFQHILPHGPVRAIQRLALQSSTPEEPVVRVRSLEEVVKLRRDWLIYPGLAGHQKQQLLCQYETGYARMEDIPWAVTQGMLIHVAHLYEGHGGFPEETRQLYRPYRRVSL